MITFTVTVGWPQIIMLVLADVLFFAFAYRRPKALL